MIERAFIRITGPPQAGKTTLIERLLEFSSSNLMVARSEARKDISDFIETRPRNDRELARYRKAGAVEVARYRFEPGLQQTDAFWDTDLMEDPAEGVVIEGDLPIPGADLTVFVAKPLPPRKPLIRRVLVDQKEAHEEKVKFFENLSEREDGLDEFLRLMLGGFADAYPPSDELRAQWRSELPGIVAKARAQKPPPPKEKWALAEGLEGLALAGVVLIHVTDPKERKRGERMLSELPRLRKDKAVFEDIIGLRGNRIPVTGRVADLSDPRDAGLKDVLWRIQKKIRDLTK